MKLLAGTTWWRLASVQGSAAALALTLSGCVGPVDAVSEADTVLSSGAAAPVASTAPDPSTSEPEMDLVLDVDFDEVRGPLHEGAPVVDDSGLHMMGAVRLGGPATEPLQPEPRGSGTALRFTRACEAGPDCPKGIVEFPSSAPLNPGTRDFRFGASVLLQPEETADGANVMQKGFSAGGRSQWKLQVDGQAGHPSCVVAGTQEGEVVVVRARVGVADGSWHDVQCLKRGDELVVMVDGVESRRGSLPAGLEVDPPSALRLGGKSVKENNDQFFGVVDDVFLAIAPEQN